MNIYNIISIVILLGSSFLCFWLPYKSGNKKTGIITGSILSLIIAWTIIGGLEFLIIFAWLFILIFQVIFLSYWIFRFFNKPKTGQIISFLFFIGFVFILLSPWISDWTFSKKDARKLLAKQNIELKDDFKIIENESGGLMDYYHTLRIEISESDKIRITQEIRNSDGFKSINDLNGSYPSADYKTFEILNFETENYLKREYYLKEPMSDGVKHIYLQLSKKKNELQYVGSDE